MKSTESCSDKVARFRELLRGTDTVLIGAGAGLSTSAGFTYTGKRFEDYFSDFIEKYGFGDMYSGGFYPFESAEEHWAYWSRYIFINRYMDVDNGTYGRLLELVEDKDYFVLTTNVDHQFQKAGFDKQRLFYTQGDYGLFQCSEPCHQETYDNEIVIRKMMEAQGYMIGADSIPVLADAVLADGAAPEMTVPSELVPRCPKCGRPMSMNLRADDTFVQDEGWYRAKERFSGFLRSHQGARMMFLELGVGMNTPVIIKYPFWQLTAGNRMASYVCLNYGESYAPAEIRKKSICIDGDIGEILNKL